MKDKAETVVWATSVVILILSILYFIYLIYVELTPRLYGVTDEVIVITKPTVYQHWPVSTRYRYKNHLIKVHRV